MRAFCFCKETFQRLAAKRDKSCVFDSDSDVKVLRMPGKRKIKVCCVWKIENMHQEGSLLLCITKAVTLQVVENVKQILKLRLVESRV